MGVAPMVYLLNWRMQIACELLQTGDQPLSAIARTVGYGSESAFSAAFCKTMKHRPGEYRRTFEIRKSKDASR
jgi:AraC-like DNA-binding protein